MNPTGPRVYYQRAEVLVNSEYLFVSGRRFALSYLDDLRTMRSSIFTPGLSGGFLFGIFLATVAGWPLLHWATIALSTTLVAAFVLVLLRRRFGRRYELWADYRGQETRLLVMYDEVLYEQLCRALLRARAASG